MAFKDWKKRKKDFWENKLEDEYEIQITDDGQKNYYVYLLEPNTSVIRMPKWKMLRKFKSKSKANKFVKNFMKKN